jgi:hypothetical protein
MDVPQHLSHRVTCFVMPLQSEFYPDGCFEAIGNHSFIHEEITSRSNSGNAYYHAVVFPSAA